MYSYRVIFSKAILLRFMKYEVVKFIFFRQDISHLHMLVPDDCISEISKFIEESNQELT